MSWDAAHVVTFFDALGEREWTRFEDGRTPAPSFATHVRMLERYVNAGDRVLDAGSGSGRFALELLRLGAHVTALDLSPVQIELLRERMPDVDAIVGDVLDLSEFPDDGFDVTVCYGGPLSYLLDQADGAVGELARVTKPDGYLVVSVMSLVGAASHYAPMLIELARRDGVGPSLEIIRTGFLRDGKGYGHLPMKLYRWSDVAALLAPYGDVIDGAPAGVMPHLAVDEPELKELLAAFDEAVADDPGSRSCGEHIIGILQVA